MGDPKQTIREAGLAARTLLMFNWSGSGPSRALRDDVLKDAIEIEGVVREFLEEEFESSQFEPPKTSEPGTKNVSESDKGGQGTSKLPKWLGKFTKK